MRLVTLLLLASFTGSVFGQSTDSTVTLVATEDAFAVRTGSTLAVAAGELYANDEIIGADSVLAMLVSPPANGSLVWSPDGAFTYTPATGFTGVDVFSYHLQTLPRQELAIDPSRSTLDLDARVSTLVGSDDDAAQATVGGDMSFFLEPNLPPYSEIQIIKMDLSLAEAVGLEFRFGGLFTIGRLFVDADSGAIRLVLNQAGAATAVTEGDFLQEGNKVGVLGTVHLRGTGVVSGSVPDDPQQFETETDFLLDGEIAFTQPDQLTFSLPVQVADTVEISGTEIELALAGVVTGSGALRVPQLSNIATVTLTVDPLTNTGIEDGLPAVFALDQSHPNPFAASTTIGYSIARSGPVQLLVYDLLGREVASLVDGYVPAGRHVTTFDGTSLPSGMYLYRLTAEGFTATRTMVLMR